MRILLSTLFILTLSFCSYAQVDYLDEGNSYLNSGDKARGYDELERLLDMFPESSYREKVKQILASR